MLPKAEMPWLDKEWYSESLLHRRRLLNTVPGVSFFSRRSALSRAGVNACVFAYGQTGSGKTYTMIGNNTRRGSRARQSPATPSDGSNSVAAEDTPGKSREEEKEVENSTTQNEEVARTSTAAEEERSNMVLDDSDGVVPRAAKDIFKLAREGLSEATEALTACEQPYRSTSPPDFGDTLTESRPPTVGAGWASTSRTTTGGSSGSSSLDDAVPNPEPPAASGTVGEATSRSQQALKREGGRGARTSRSSDRPGSVRGTTAREGNEKRAHGETICSVEFSYMQVRWGAAARKPNDVQCSQRNACTSL